MTPIDLALALTDVRNELVTSEWLRAEQIALKILIERPGVLSAIINKLDLTMTPSPEYAAKVPAFVRASPLALGILQGRGVPAQRVTTKRAAAAQEDYDARLTAETDRRIKAGLPLTGNLPTPDDLAPPASAFKPPWET